MTSKRRTRAWRRWVIGVLAVLVVAAGLIAALPWLVALPAGQRWLAALASRIMAPGRVEFRSLRLSWHRPTVVSDFALRDAAGDRVVSAPRGVFQWNLWQILFAQPPGATLTLENADLDIERFPDGTVDLHETLKPIIEEFPRKRLLIRIEDGRLRFRDPAFPEPVVADHANIVVDLSVRSEPISWKLDLAKNGTDGERPQLKIDGSYSRSDVDSEGRHDLTLSLVGSRWPWTLANKVVQSRGELSGRIDASFVRDGFGWKGMPPSTTWWRSATRFPPTRSIWIRRARSGRWRGATAPGRSAGSISRRLWARLQARARFLRSPGMAPGC